MTFVVELPDVEMSKNFHPYAFFDKHMDCIRVRLHDVSVCEVRIDKDFTLHRCNDEGDTLPTYSGFTIKGVYHLLHELGIPETGAIHLAELVDMIVKYRPASTMAAMLGLFDGQIPDFGENKISFDDDSIALAA